MSTWRGYWRLMRFDRPIGIYLLLWPTAWALWIAGGGHPPLLLVGVFLLGVVLMRALGCVVNDWCDRGIDGLVARTQQRPLPAGELQPRQAIYCAVVLGVLAATLALCFLNRGTVLLAIVGLALAIIYPLMKRVFAMPQLVLGLAFSWSVPMVFWQLQQHIPSFAWWWMTIAWIWPVMYDTQYAMVDEDDDRQIGVRSTAILFGRHTHTALRVGQILLLLLWVLLGWSMGLAWPYFTACVLAGLLFLYQDFCVRRRERSRYFAAFLSNHWIGLLIFLGLLFSIR